LPTPSNAWVRTSSGSATATCSRCMKRSPGRTHTAPRCASTLPALRHGWTVGGLQPDEQHPGLFVLGEANFPITGQSPRGQRPDAGPRRRVLHLPYTISDYLARITPGRSQRPMTIREALAGVEDRTEILSIKGRRPYELYSKLGAIMWSTAACRDRNRGVTQGP
jgi:hypothetical protein